MRKASSVSGVKRGKSFRRSFGPSNFMSLVILPVRKPCPSGPQATRPMPSSSQSENFVILGSRIHKEFLSVMNRMSGAIIHNSDYKLAEERMLANDRYFDERNEHFSFRGP